MNLYRRIKNPALSSAANPEGWTYEPYIDGGQAFPSMNSDLAELPHRHGMSLRDWFAGQALAGYCAHPNTGTVKDNAERALQQADAMLEARAKPRGDS